MLGATEGASDGTVLESKSVEDTLGLADGASLDAIFTKLGIGEGSKLGAEEIEEGMALGITDGDHVCRDTVGVSVVGITEGEPEGTMDGIELNT